VSDKDIVMNNIHHLVTKPRVGIPLFVVPSFCSDAKMTRIFYPRVSSVMSSCHRLVDIASKSENGAAEHAPSAQLLRYRLI
jgi:hypothetical protein